MGGPSELSPLTAGSATATASTSSQQNEPPQIVTVENSLERRLLLSGANTQGKKFSATGGLHLTLDDVLTGAEYSFHEKEKEHLMKEKAHRIKLMVAEAKGKLVLERKGDDITKYSVPDLDALLAW